MGWEVYADPGEALVPSSVRSSMVVAEYLPLMRRYARALSGRQSSGDAYVAAALEAVLAEPGVLEGA